MQIDGAAVAALPSGKVEVDPGRHVFVVKAAGHDTTTIMKVVSPADTEITLTAPKTIVVDRTAAPKPVPVYQRAWFWTTIGVAVTGAAAVGVIMAVQPKAATPAGPPTSTVDRLIPASAVVRF